MKLTIAILALVCVSAFASWGDVTVKTRGTSASVIMRISSRSVPKDINKLGGAEMVKAEGYPVLPSFSATILHRGMTATLSRRVHSSCSGTVTTNKFAVSDPDDRPPSGDRGFERMTENDAEDKNGNALCGTYPCSPMVLTNVATGVSKVTVYPVRVPIGGNKGSYCPRIAGSISFKHNPNDKDLSNERMKLDASLTSGRSKTVMAGILSGGRAKFKRSLLQTQVDAPTSMCFHGNVAASIQSLVDWNNKKGVSTSMTDASSMTSDDIFEDIYNQFQADSSLKYISLVGGLYTVDTFWDPYEAGSHNGGTENPRTGENAEDWFYSDSMYGMVTQANSATDWFDTSLPPNAAVPDVYVGRMFGTSSELSDWADKILCVERLDAACENGNGGANYGSSYYMGSRLGPGHNSDQSDCKHMKLIQDQIGGVLGCPYSSPGVSNSQIDCDFTGLNGVACFGNHANNGGDGRGLIMSAGHGCWHPSNPQTNYGYGNWLQMDEGPGGGCDNNCYYNAGCGSPGCGDCSYRSMDSSNQLDNNAGTYPTVLLVACLSANLDTEWGSNQPEKTVLHNMIHNGAGKGGNAMFGSVGLTPWEETMTVQDAFVEMVHGVDVSPTGTPSLTTTNVLDAWWAAMGYMIPTANSNNDAKKCIRIWLYFGWSHYRMRTSAASSYSLTYDACYTAGTDEVVSGTGSGDLCGVSQSGTFKTAATADSSGCVLTMASWGTVDLTVTGDNMAPEYVSWPECAGPPPPPPPPPPIGPIKWDKYMVWMAADVAEVTKELNGDDAEAKAQKFNFPFAAAPTLGLPSEAWIGIAAGALFVVATACVVSFMKRRAQPAAEV